MAATPEPIARIRLLRSWPRLLALPTVLGAGAIALIVGGPLVVGGVPGLLLAALAILPVVAVVLLVARVATMRVEVAEASVHVRWLGGARHYALVPGPVTRVRLRGDEASDLRARSRFLGFQLGGATLRRDEEIEVVRLAPTRTAILVPTDRGRLAIAASSEPELLDALTRAARARELRAEEAPPEPEPQPEAEAEAQEDEPDEPPHVLTGIERAMLDERLARELNERLETERREAGRLEDERRAELAAAAKAEEEAATHAAAEAEAAQRPPSLRERVPSASLLLLPIVATLAVWGFGLATGRLPDAASDQGRLTALALVLAGPACSVGAIMARAWWPRLVAAVVTGGLTATVFVGRAVLGA